MFGTRSYIHSVIWSTSSASCSWPLRFWIVGQQFEKICFETPDAWFRATPCQYRLLGEDHMRRSYNISSLYQISSSWRMKPKNRFWLRVIREVDSIYWFINKYIKIRCWKRLEVKKEKKKNQIKFTFQPFGLNPVSFQSLIFLDSLSITQSL